MKNLFKIIVVVLSILVFNGCHKDLITEINDLKDQVTDLETLVNDMNTTLNSTQTLIQALENNDHIEKIDPIYKNGVISGYSISFTSGSVVDLYNGTDGVTPIIGIQQYSTTGYYYWTIKIGSGEPVWMTNSYGLKIRATGTIPEMKIEDGYWWVTFDDGLHWTKLYQATGNDGTTVFKNIDYSDPYFVKFTLIDGTTFTIPTMKGVNELNAMCDTINNNISAFTTIINDIDTSLFIKATAEIVENDTIVGYRITLNNGQVFEVKNGHSNNDDIFFGIKQNSADLKNYWTIQFGKSGYEDWIIIDGNMLPADPQDGTPVINVADTLGSYYFTIQYGSAPAQFMKNSKGELVQATDRRTLSFFKDVSINNTSVIFTLLSGSVVTIERTRQSIPTIALSNPNEAESTNPVMTIGASGIYQPGVYGDKTYTFDAIIRDTVYNASEPYSSYEDYCDGMNVKVSAIGLDESVVTGTQATAFTAVPIVVADQTIYQYDITIKVTFKTPSVVEVSRTTRVAVFFTWNNRTIMKVITFQNNV